jgi:hypothetical protein
MLRDISYSVNVGTFDLNKEIILEPIILIKYVAVSILFMPRGIKKGLNAKKFDGCVTKVKRKSGKKVNPYAVCNATMSGKSKNKRK